MHSIAKLSPFLAALAVSLSLTVGPVAHATGPTTATPTPTATPQPTAAPSATPFIWPFRYVISGPSSAHPGDVVTYRVDVELVGSRDEGGSFQLGWTENAASFVSARDAAANTDVPLLERTAQRVDLAFARSGTAEVTLRVDPNFTGTLVAGIDVRGTSITMPDGAVLAAYTTVAPGLQESGLPGTGMGPNTESPWPKANVAAVLAGAVGISLMGIAVLRRRRS